MNMKVYVIFLLNILWKLKMNLYYKHEQKNEMNFLIKNKLKFNFEPRM